MRLDYLCAEVISVGWMSSPSEGRASTPRKRRRGPWSAPAKRYPTDLTDAQWAWIAPLLPPPATSGPREAPGREIVNARLHLDWAGCAWRLLPNNFPPCETVYWNWARWRDDGSVDQLHDRLRAQVRDADGRDRMASAGIVDSQSLRGADTVGADHCGYDAGKRVNGTKRHIVTDTLGLLLVVMVTAASVQDRDGGRRVLDRLRFTMPSVALIFAAGYAGRLVVEARQTLRVAIEIVRNPESQRGFAVLPRQWGGRAHPCRGWCAADAWPATTSASPAAMKPWSSGP